MSNLMINKLKHIDNSRRDLATILENKGVDLTSSNKSLDSLIGSVGQLSLNNEVNTNEWTGVAEQAEPTYWKGDEDWGRVINIDSIMEADDKPYTGKAFFLIRCSDNDQLDEYSNGYTNAGIVGFQAYRFSDQSDSDALGTSTAHKFDPEKDIVAPNGERFRWIIGYTNSTTAIVLWQSNKLVVEAAVYWSGTFRGICFEDAAPYRISSSDYRTHYAYDNGSGGYSYIESFSMTNYNAAYLNCTAPRYFEVKESVTTQFITGDYDNRFAYSADNDRTRTIIVDGTCVCEFMRSGARKCTFIRLSKPGYRRYLYLNCNEFAYNQPAYIYADISGCKGTVWCSASHAYIRLVGEPQPHTINFSEMRNSNILADAVWGVAGAANCDNTNFDLGIIHGSVGDKCFMNNTGHIKFDWIEQGIGQWAFLNATSIPTEVIVKKREGYTSDHTLGWGAFSGTNVEKINLRDSAFTALQSSGYDPESETASSDYYRVLVRQPFYGAEHLRFIELPKFMTTIPAWSISKLYNLESLVLPDNLTTIGRYGIFGNPWLTSISAIPSTLQSLGDHAFANNSSLETIEINSESLTSIPAWCMESCGRLTKVVLPQKLTTLGEGCFGSCSNLEHITLPTAVVTIGARAFRMCYKLKTVELEDPTVGYLVNLGSYAFNRCHSLETIPDLSHLTQAGATEAASPFQACRSLTLTMLPTKPTNMSAEYYYNYFYRGMEGKLLVPADYSYTSTMQLGGAKWSVQDIMDFIYSLPDRTGLTKITFNLGSPAICTRYSYENTNYTNDYTTWSTIGAKYYVKEKEDGTGLDYSLTQADDTWIIATTYIANKNWALA